ncbi:hypothetical protein Bbelb_199410 [Branchiostoma belcheri]|nr:hypothetical protein Bbelb_199410 [Branchiostoma belcheri]
MDEKKLNLETWLECWPEFPEMNEDNVKEYLKIVDKLKIFVKVADEKGSSPKTALAARAIMEAMYGLTSECKSREFAATMEHTLSDLRTIAEQLSQQDPETSWKSLEGVLNSIRSFFGQEIQDIRKDCHHDPRQGIECVTKQLQDMHKDYITNQIKWQLADGFVHTLGVLDNILHPARVFYCKRKLQQGTGASRRHALRR